MTRQQQFDLWCQSFGYDPSRDSCGEFRNHTARLLWEAWLAGQNAVLDRLDALYPGAHYLFNNPPGEADKAVLDAIEWYHASIAAMRG